MTRDEAINQIADLLAEDDGFVVVNDATRRSYRYLAERCYDIAVKVIESGTVK